MKTYSTKKPVKKLVTINIDLDSAEEEVRDLIKKGNDLLATLESMNEDKLQRTEAEIVKVKKDIEVKAITIEAII